MPEMRSSLVLTAETKGFEKALRQTLGLNKAALADLKKQAAQFVTMQAEVKGLEKQLGSLVKQELELAKTMSKVDDKSSGRYRKMQTDLKAVQEQSRNLNRIINLQKQAYSGTADAAQRLNRAQSQIRQQQAREAQQSRWAGMQGFMQGAAPGMAPLFLQRGPGMWRQAAGMAAGGMVRGAAGAPFAGVAGMQQAMASIPIIGGAAAGQLGAAAGFTQQALAYQRQRVEAFPFVQPAPSRRVQRIRARQARARAQARGQATPGFEYFDPGTGQVYPGMEQRARRLETGLPAELAIQAGSPQPTTELGLLGETLVEGFTGKILGRQIGGAIRDIFGIEGGRPGRNFGMNRTPEQRTAERKRLDVLDQGKWARERAQIAEQNRQRELRRAARAETPEAMAMRLRGLGRQEALQETVQLMQAGGDVFQGGRGQRQFLGAAMAARTLFGVDAQTAGAFQMGARRGGLVGGIGRGGESLREALSDAVDSLGLRGPEVTQYLQIVAQGIQQFQMTGIPMSKDSLKDMAGELSRGGLAATRAQNVARGFQQVVQGMGARGPRGGFDLMLMQAFGGYTGTGGAKELEQTFIQMEELSQQLGERGVMGIETGGPMGDVMRRVMEMGGGGAGGRLFLRRILGAQGIQLGARETEILGKRLMGEDIGAAAAMLPPTEARIEGPGATIKEMMGKAAQVVTRGGPNLRQQAAVLDKQIQVGNKLATAVMQMEQSAANTTSAFSNLAGGPITELTKSFVNLTQKIDKLTGGEGSMIDKLFNMTMGQN